MIILHKINGDEFVLNADQIEVIEARPDTTITLSNDRKYLVKEPVAEIIHKIIEYQKLIQGK